MFKDVKGRFKSSNMCLICNAEEKIGRSKLGDIIVENFQNRRDLNIQIGNVQSHEKD